MRTASLFRKFFVSTSTLCLLGSGLLLASAHQAHAQTGLIISQIYGGGGSTSASATYNQDFIELFNGSGAAINLSGYTLQYASATGTFSATGVNNFALSGTIQNNRFFLISTGTVNANTMGAAVPNADIANGTLALSNTAGKVALASSSAAVTSPTASNVVDFVGYGTTANAFEGAGPAPTPTSVATSLIRSANAANTAFVDSNNNAADFINTAANSPGPRYSGSVSPFADTPEPGTLPLVGMGLAGGAGMIGGVRRRKAKQAA